MHMSRSRDCCMGHLARNGDNVSASTVSATVCGLSVVSVLVANLSPVRRNSFCDAAGRHCKTFGFGKRRLAVSSCHKPNNDRLRLDHSAHTIGFGWIVRYDRLRLDHSDHTIGFGWIVHNDRLRPDHTDNTIGFGWIVRWIGSAGSY